MLATSRLHPQVMNTLKSIYLHFSVTLVCSNVIQELEAERVKLMEGVTSNKRKMKELEDNLLFRLTSTQVSFNLDLNTSRTKTTFSFTRMYVILFVSREV